MSGLRGHSINIRPPSSRVWKARCPWNPCVCTQRWRKKYTSPASISAARRKRTMGQILLGSGVIGELVEFSAFEKFAFPTGIELASLDQNLGELVEKLTLRFTNTFTSPEPS